MWPGEQKMQAPQPASELAERETARRNAARARGPCRSGCGVLDDEVLLSGGFDRGSVVGVSAAPVAVEERLTTTTARPEFGLVLGLQVVVQTVRTGERALVVAPRAAATAVLTALRAALEAEDPGPADATCLQRVMVARVFDLDGVWEALAELDGRRDDDDDDNDDRPWPPPPPAVIVISHLAVLVGSLFTQRAPMVAHETLARFGQRLRRLAHTLPSLPLVLLVNTTTATASTACPSTVLASPDMRPPAFAAVIAPWLDTHVLCSPWPTAAATLVEVLRDDDGVWPGRPGPRPSREGRWALLRRARGGGCVVALASPADA